jgi:hypothetical protein
MIMKLLRLLFLLLLVIAVPLRAQERVPQKATAAQVAAGVNDTRYVTPKALADAGWTPGGSGGGVVSNEVNMDFELDTWYTNSTEYWVQPIGVVELQGDPTIVEFQVRTNLADLTEDYMRRFAVAAGSVTAVQDGLVAPGHAWRWFLASGNATMNETAPNGNELIYWGSGGGGGGSLDAAAVAVVVGNSVESGTNNFVGEGSGLTRVNAIRSDYSRNDKEPLSVMNSMEVSQQLLGLDGTVDKSYNQIHIATPLRLKNGHIALYYGHWETNALTGPANYGSIRMAVSTNGMDFTSFAVGKVGSIIHPTNLTSDSYTYVTGPSVAEIDGTYYMTVFAGTNTSGTFEGVSSAGLLLTSTNGTNWVESPSSPYAPMAAYKKPTNPYSYTNWNVGNVFVGSIVKYENLWYIHYIGYGNSDFGNPATAQDLGFVFTAISTNPAVADSWQLQVGIDTCVDTSGNLAGVATATGVGGNAQVRRMRDGRWLMDLGWFRAVSTNSHPTNFVLLDPKDIRFDTANTDANYQWSYGLFEDDGWASTAENNERTKIYLTRPKLSRRNVLAERIRSASSLNTNASFYGQLDLSSLSQWFLPSGFISESGHLNSNLWRQVANNIAPWTVPSYTNQLVITNSGSLSIDGTWYYDVPRMAFTNASEAGMGAFYWNGWPAAGEYDLIFTNATFSDYESFEMFASAEWNGTYLNVWYDSAFDPVAGVGGYYTGTTTTGLEFLGTFTGNLSGGTNLPASGLADGTTGTGAFVRQTNSSIYSMSVTNLFLTSKTTVVAPTSNDGVFWNSNKVLYWVTTTKTNVVSDGR